MFLTTLNKWTRFIVYLFALSLSGCIEQEPTDYQRDIQALDKGIAELSAQLKTIHQGTIPYIEISKKLIELYHNKANLTGDYQYFENHLNQVAIDSSRSPFFLYAKSSFNATLHKYREAKQSISELPPEIKQLPHVQALTADISLQIGEYKKAEQILRFLAVNFPSWDNLTRLAYYELNTGQVELAKRLYKDAADRLSAKQMRQYAWINLQLGLLELSQKKYQKALEYYQTADRAYSGYWLIQEHMAEVLALMGKKKKAIALYRKVLSSTWTPELLLALAKLIPDTQESKRLEFRAMSELEKKYVRYPEATAGHFIEHLLTLPTIHPKLLDYAKANHINRPNADAKILLAKSYLKFNQTDKAEELYDEALSTPWRNSALNQLELMLANKRR